MTDSHAVFYCSKRNFRTFFLSNPLYLMKGGICVMLDFEEQYDNIYRYCYFKIHHAQTAEDITQETLLRYWERYHLLPDSLSVRYLYIIAKNLCIDEYRKQKNLPLVEALPEPLSEETLLEKISVHTALSFLSEEEQELLLLRYINEVPIGTIAKLLYHCHALLLGKRHYKCARLANIAGFIRICGNYIEF